MGKSAKLYRKIKHSPNAVSPQELHRLLTDYGFQYRDGTKHWRVYWRNDLGPGAVVTVPFQRPLKAYVVKQALKLIELVESAPETE